MRTGEKSAFNWKAFLIAGLIGGGAAVAVTMIVLLIMSGLILGGMLDGSGAVVAIDVAAAVGALVGGLICARRSEAGALPCGAVSAVVQFIICMLVGLLFYESFSPANGGVALAASMLAGSLVGALLGTRRVGTKPRRKK